ncbi:hypothetical protein LguiB_018295 [Lonicera macranthoides]
MFVTKKHFKGFPIFMEKKFLVLSISFHEDLEIFKKKSLILEKRRFPSWE